MGKHYSASADSHADAQSFAVCHSNIDAFSVADFCISNFEPGRDGVSESRADSDNVPHCNAGSFRERKALANQSRTVCIPCQVTVVSWSPELLTVVFRVPLGVPSALYDRSAVESVEGLAWDVTNEVRVGVFRA